MKLYYAKVEPLTPGEMEQIKNILPEERLQKLENKKQETNRLQSIYAGLLLEYGLQKYGCSSRMVTFLTMEDGKPYIKERPDIFYNLTHSGDYVALAIGQEPVGVDMEMPRIGYQKLVNRFFAKEEVEFLTENRSDDVFTKLWTRKESYLKATGYGMRMPLDSFSVLGQVVEVKETMPEEMVPEKGVFFMESFRIEEYWLSVCSSKGLEKGSLTPEKVDLKVCMMS